MSDTESETVKDQTRKLEVWKYYGGIGGADKDRMIQIVTWLLAFSAAIVGFYATGDLNGGLPKSLLLVLGLLISLSAAFIALLYGEYAAWNWSIADRIAEENNWKEQTPDFVPFILEGPWTEKLVRRLAKPCKDRIAPVFWFFFIVSLASFIVHVVLLLDSLGVLSPQPKYLPFEAPKFR